MNRGESVTQQIRASFEHRMGSLGVETVQRGLHGVGDLGETGIDHGLIIGGFGPRALQSIGAMNSTETLEGMGSEGSRSS